MNPEGFSYQKIYETERNMDQEKTFNANDIQVCKRVCVCVSAYDFFIQASKIEWTHVGASQQLA